MNKNLIENEKNIYFIDEIILFKSFKKVVFKLKDNKWKNFSITVWYDKKWNIKYNFIEYEDVIFNYNKINNWKMINSTFIKNEENEILKDLNILKLFEKIIIENDNEEITKIVWEISWEINLILN